mmetsp:Transcript_9213/g.19127  ORF Transcript_9213/g.19127 Transcript_9213/m.19127 type:complete len:505 (-) Transcript_9213:1943-3457(-)
MSRNEIQKGVDRPQHGSDKWDTLGGIPVKFRKKGQTVDLLECESEKEDKVERCRRKSRKKRPTKLKRIQQIQRDIKDERKIEYRQPDSRRPHQSATGASSQSATNIEEERQKPAPSQHEGDKNESVVSRIAHTESLGVVPEEMKQRQVVYRSFGILSAEHIKIEELPDALHPPSPYHVVVKVTASTVSLQDCLLRRGFDFGIANPVSLPIVPGHEFVGSVIVRGERARGFQIGERVTGVVRTGGNARFIAVQEEMIAPVPSGIDLSEALCVVSAYAPAYQAMKMVASRNAVFSLAGKRVLVVGSMDGTALAIIEMCRKAKARVFVTAPDSLQSYVQASLSVSPLPERSSDWLPVVKESMDLVFDGTCEDGMAASLRALNKSGELVCYGRSSLLKQKMGLLGAPLSAYFDGFLTSRARFFDIWESCNREPETFRKNLQALFQLLKWKKIKPIVSKQIGLDEVGLSHHHIEQRKFRPGTIVCLPWKKVQKKKIVFLDEDSIGGCCS